MKGQELQSLHEAYIDVYAKQNLTEEITEYFSEEVEIAAQYFYEMGLNEDGVDILIEELGVEEFANFVYDIAEEYVLTEARRGPGGTKVKIEPKLSTGKAIQGKPKAASLKALRKKKAARQEAENKASESKPSGLTASLKRQTEIRDAARKQPKKPGVLDRVAGVVNRGIEAAQKRAASDVEKRKKFVSAAKETGKTIRKAAEKVGGVAREVGRGASGATRLAGHVARQGLNNEYIMGYLIDEGYAETPEAAYAILENMGEEWIENVVEEILYELNRAERETGINTKTGRPTSTGGMKGDAAFIRTKKMIRGMEGTPAGQRKKVPGKKPPAAGEYGSGVKSPAQRLALKRASEKRSQEFQSDTRGT